VLFASSKIAPTLPLQQQPIGTGGHIATILFTLPSRALLPFFILYLRWWRGVDSKNLNLFCALFTLFISCSISTLFTLQSQVAFMIADSFLSMPPGLGAFIAFPIVLTSSLTMPAMFFLWPWLSWPRIQQKKDGRWIVTSLFHPLGIEESSFEPGPVAEEALKSVPIWILIFGGLVGALVWSSIVIPLVLRWVYNIFINHISYRSPMSFLRSIYILLTTPFVILEDEVRITVEELCPEAVGAAKQRASSRNNNS
jgi:hypothetical protein